MTFVSLVTACQQHGWMYCFSCLCQVFHFFFFRPKKLLHLQCVDVHTNTTRREIVRQIEWVIPNFDLEHIWLRSLTFTFERFFFQTLCDSARRLCLCFYLRLGSLPGSVPPGFCTLLLNVFSCHTPMSFKYHTAIRCKRRFVHMSQIRAVPRSPFAVFSVRLSISRQRRAAENFFDFYCTWAMRHVTLRFNVTLCNFARRIE